MQHGGGFLNCYDCSYAGRNVVNQAPKVAPGVIKVATNDINTIVEQKINQIIFKDSKEVEHVPSKY